LYGNMLLPVVSKEDQNNTCWPAVYLQNCFVNLHIFETYFYTDHISWHGGGPEHDGRFSADLIIYNRWWYKVVEVTRREVGQIEGDYTILVNTCHVTCICDILPFAAKKVIRFLWWQICQKWRRWNILI
jgi:hypothetical protein